MDLFHIGRRAHDREGRGGHRARRFPDDGSGNHSSLDGGHVYVEIKVYGAFEPDRLERDDAGGVDQ
jgi:hypothetical protein